MSDIETDKRKRPVMQKSVNRSLDDRWLDSVDHALGRPADPLAETYRNHYCTEECSVEAENMRFSDYWSEAGPLNGGKDVIFKVTLYGRESLADYLKTTAA